MPTRGPKLLKSPASPRSGICDAAVRVADKEQASGRARNDGRMNPGSPGIRVELLDASPFFFHDLLRLPTQPVGQREVRRHLPLVAAEDALRVFTGIGKVARGLAERILISHEEVGHRQARGIVVKAEAAVLEVGVVDIRLVQFEIVTKGDIVLSLGPGEHVAEIIRYSG